MAQTKSYVHRLYRFVLPTFGGYQDGRLWTRFEVARFHITPAPTEPAESPEGAPHLISIALYESWRATLEQAVCDAFQRLEAARCTGAPQTVLIQADTDHTHALERVWTPQRTMLIRTRVPTLSSRIVTAPPAAAP